MNITFYATGQLSTTHYFTILRAMLYYRLNDLTFPVKNPLWVILVIWEVFSKLFLVSNYLIAKLLPKSVNEFFMGSLTSLKLKPKSDLRKLLVFSSISKIYWLALDSFWFISARWANFFKLSLVKFIFPFIFLSSTLLLNIVRVSLWRY